MAAGGNVKPGHPLGGAAAAAAAAAAAVPGDRGALPTWQRDWIGGNPGEQQQQGKDRRSLRRPEHPGGDDASHHQHAGGRRKPGVGASGKEEEGDRCVGVIFSWRW